MKCFIYRIWISHALDRGRALGGRVQAHVDRCTGCERFHAESVALGRELRDGMSARNGEWDPFLTERIMARVDREDRRRGTRSVLRVRTPWTVVLATCLVVALTLGLILIDPFEDEAPDRDQVAASFEAVSQLGQKLFGRHLETDSELLGLVAEPLTAEVDRLTEDAETMTGLVAAFLPLDLLHTESGSGPR